MNWGIKILLLYLGFVAMIIALVVGSSMQEIHMVTDDYYEEELAYGEQIQRIKNTQELPERVEIAYDKENHKIILQYPEQFGDISGKMVLYRPSDSQLDREIEIDLDEALKQEIATEDLLYGMWRLKINWQAEQKDYYQEEVVIIS